MQFSFCSKNFSSPSISLFVCVPSFCYCNSYFVFRCSLYRCDYKNWMKFVLKMESTAIIRIYAIQFHNKHLVQLRPTLSAIWEKQKRQHIEKSRHTFSSIINGCAKYNESFRLFCALELCAMPLFFAMASAPCTKINSDKINEKLSKWMKLMFSPYFYPMLSVQLCQSIIYYHLFTNFVVYVFFYRCISMFTIVWISFILRPMPVFFYLSPFPPSSAPCRPLPCFSHISRINRIYFVLRLFMRLKAALLPLNDSFHWLCIQIIFICFNVTISYV